MRGTFGGLAIIGFITGLTIDFEPVREAAALAVSLAAIAGTAVSVFKRVKKGRGPEAEKIAARLDLIAAMAGVVGIIAGAVAAGGPVWLSILRLLVGAFFMGVLTDSMALGHWYLVQPGLTRDPIREQLLWAGGLWGLELLVWLLPTGMVSVFTGAVEDGHDGLLGWFWAASIATTGVLVFAGLATLREKGYQAVMAATGLAYLSLLTGVVADIVGRLALRG